MNNRIHGNRLKATVSTISMVAIAGFLGGCAAQEPTDDGSADVPIVFATPGTTQGPAQAPYTALPFALGYYEDEGLDVTQADYDGASVVAQALEANQADIGMVSTPPLFLLAGQEGGSDLVAVFTNTTTQLTIVAVQPDSDIQSAADFEGKTIGVISLAHSSVPIIQAMCVRAGCDPSSMTFVPVGQGATAAAALEQGQVQVLGTYDGGFIEIERAGVALRAIEDPLLTSGPTAGFSNALIVRKADLEDPEKREAFIKVCRAQAKATLFAMTNPEAAVRIVWERYPESKPTGVSEAEALERGIDTLNARLANMQPVDETWGLATDQQIEGARQLQLLSGQLEEPVEISELWTDELLEEINSFDAEAVEKDANDWES